MTEFNLTPKFKYSTLLCCQVKDSFNIHRQNRAKTIHENHQHVKGWYPTTRKKNEYNIVFRKPKNIRPVPLAKN